MDYQARLGELFTLRGDFAEPGSHLQVLYVDSLTEYGLKTVIAQCRHLHSLGIYHRIRAFLDATYTDPEDRPAEICLHHLRGSAVRKLHLQNFEPLSDDHLEPLCDLEELCIAHHGTEITNAGIVGVARRCPALHTLCIFAGTEPTRFFVLRHCPVLKSLEYYADVALSDRADPYSVEFVQNTKAANPQLQRLILVFD